MRLFVPPGAALCAAPHGVLSKSRMEVGSVRIVGLGEHVEHVEDVGILQQGKIDQILDSTIADQ